jgi:nucleoside 2-deoxyribosyltransferase
MKNIYFAHPREINYQELYKVLKKNFSGDKINLILPYENKVFSDSKEFLKNKCDLVIAEVSKKATGLGIELGWANLFEIPIVCFYQKGNKMSRSLGVICDQFFEYEDLDDFGEKTKEVVEKR